MKKLVIAMTLVIVALIGCTAGVILHESFAPEALAQAQAPEHQYTACTAVMLPTAHNPKHLNSGKPLEQDRMLKVPEGWTPVGGSAGGIIAHVILCR